MAYTEQDAVNTLLIARSLVPVNTLGSGHPDVTAAREILSRRHDEVHSKNWWFNTEYEVQFTPDAEGKISLPSTILRIDNATYTILEGYLYDIENRTTLFTEDPDEVTVIYSRTWEELPAVPYHYIVALAKEEFIRPMESQLLTARAADDIKMALANMQMAQMQYNDPATSVNPLMQKWQTKMIQR